MKTITSYLILLFFGGLLFLGCEKNGYEVSESDNPIVDKQYVELSAFNQMQAFNDSLFLTKPTRGWGWFFKSCAIAGADIAGFGAGAGSVSAIAAMTGAATAGTGAAVVMGVAGTICAVGASYIAFDQCYGYTTLYGDDPKIDYTSLEEVREISAVAVAEIALKGTREETKINLPDKYAYLNEMGVLHNVMLEKIEAVECGQLDLSKTCVDENPELARIVDSEEFHLAYDAIIEAVSASQGDFGAINVAEFCGATGVKITENTEKAYRLFLDAYNQFPQNLTDVKFLINEYH